MRKAILIFFIFILFVGTALFLIMKFFSFPDLLDGRQKTIQLNNTYNFSSTENSIGFRISSSTSREVIRGIDSLNWTGSIVCGFAESGYFVLGEKPIPVIFNSYNKFITYTDSCSKNGSKLKSIKELDL